MGGRPGGLAPVVLPRRGVPAERSHHAVRSNERLVHTGSNVTEDTAAMPTSAEATLRDMVTVRLPAASAYLSVLRTATAGLAARLDFTLDEIEDLRIAVDEACAMLLPDAAPGADLTCRFSLAPDALSVTVEVSSRTGRAPRRNTFAWTVLTALAGEVDAQAGPGDRVA